MRIPAAVASLSLLVSTVLLTGCSASFSTRSLVPTNSSIGVLQGQVRGGQQPIAGAQVYLYAAGTLGPGAPSTSLLTSDVLSDSPAGGVDSAGNYYVTTNSAGVFKITNDYTCTAGTQLYIYSIGGADGYGTNAAAGLMAVLGQCPASGTFADTLPFVYASEVSTVAAAYALAGFATDATHISGPALTDTLGQTGMANAFANAAQMYSILNGGGALTTTPNGYGSVPQKEINSLANSLAACVNSTGALTNPDDSPTACGTLFADATSDGTTHGTMPTDTATAAINIAHFPGKNVADIFGLSTSASSPPFGPPLGSAPNDFTIALAFNDSGSSTTDANQPFSIAIDASGDAWVANFNANTISEFSSLGAPIGSPIIANPLSKPYEPSDPYWIAIADSGNVGVLNYSYYVSNNPSVISEFTSSGTPVAHSPFTSDGYALEFAFDGSGDIWLSNQISSGNTANVTELTPAGTEATGSPFTPKGSNALTLGIIALDGHGNVWVTDGYYDAIELNSKGAEVSGSPFTTGGVYLSQAMAIDNAGSVFFASGLTNDLGKILATGSPASGSPYTNDYIGGELLLGNALAVDGSGNLWGSNFNNIIELSNDGDVLSPYYTGFTSSFLQSPELQVTAAGLALDGSGDVWVASPGFQQGYVLEFIGASTPVVTPIATGVKNNTLGSRP